MSVGSGQVGAEAREDLLEGGNHPHHDDPDDQQGHDNHRDRIEQRRLDLALDREDLFLVVREPVEDRIEHAGGFPGMDEVAVELVELERMLAERLREAGARFDARLQVHDEAREARIAVAAGDDLEGLQHRHARPQHRRELSREERDLPLADLLAAAERELLDLLEADALAPQVGRDDGLRRGFRLAADLAVVAIDAFPDERVFLDVLARCGGGGHGGYPVSGAERRYSLVMASISSREVMPIFTLMRPDFRRSRTPSFCAWSAMSSCVQLRMMSCRISSEIGIT